MNLIDNFLEIVTDEFGNKIDFSNLETEGFSGVVKFENNSADVYISESNFDVYNSDLTDEENRMLFEFAIYAQNKIKESRYYFLKNKVN